MPPMSTRPPANCKLKIDGRDTRVVISPYIGQGGFELSNDALGARENFSLGPRPATLHEILLRQAGQAFVVELLDGRLGQVDEYRGYAAADMGPHTRRVTSLKFGLAHRGGLFKFRFEGIADPVDRTSIFQGAPTALMRSQYRFDIELEIADDDLQIYVVDAVALQAMQAYAKSAK